MMLEIQTEPVPGLQGCQQRHEGSEPSPTHDGQACRCEKASCQREKLGLWSSEQEVFTGGQEWGG